MLKAALLIFALIGNIILGGISYGYSNDEDLKPPTGTDVEDIVCRSVATSGRETVFEPFSEKNCLDRISLIAADYIRSFFGNIDNADLKIRYRISSKILQDQKFSSVPVGLYPAQLSNRMRVDVAIFSGKRKVETIPVWILLSMKKAGLVARNDLRVGEFITELSVMPGEVDAFSSNCSQPVLESTARWIVKKSIKKGWAICSEHVEKHPDIARGVSVSMGYQKQSILLEIPVITLEDGIIGELVLVEVVPTGARVLALVVGQGKVRYEKSI